MRMSQSDYIMRMIEQLGAAMRRLREMLARGASEAPDVLRETVEAQTRLFGPLWPLVQQVSPETAVSLVPEARQVEVWVELIRLEADAAGLLGDEARAGHLRDRAKRLLAALRERDAQG